MTLRECWLPRILLAIVLSASPILGDEKIGLCCLCGGCALPAQHNTRLNEMFTCGSLALHMANPRNFQAGDSACRQFQNEHRATCCPTTASAGGSPAVTTVATPRANAVDTPPTAVQVAPGQSQIPPYTFPVCHLCPDGSAPTTTHAAVAILQYPEITTCMGLYNAGRIGIIESRLCIPIRNAVANACGCGKDSSAPKETNPSSPLQLTAVGGNTPTPSKKDTTSNAKSKQSLYESTSKTNKKDRGKYIRGRRL